MRPESSQGGSADQTPPEPGEVCLNPLEVEILVIGRDSLPEHRLAHLETCATCSEVLAAAEPTERDLAEFLLILPPRDIPAARAPRRRSWVAAAGIVVLAGVAAGLVLRSWNDSRDLGDLTTRYERDREAWERERASLEEGLAILGRDNEARKVELRAESDRMKAIMAALESEMKDRAVPDWSPSTLNLWVLSARIASSERAAEIFDECRRRGVTMAIPKAVIYARSRLRDDDDQVRPQVRAARQFLLKYDDREIEDEILRRAPQLEGEKSETRILDLFRRDRDKIRQVDEPQDDEKPAHDDL